MKTKEQYIRHYYLARNAKLKIGKAEQYKIHICRVDFPLDTSYPKQQSFMHFLCTVCFIYLQVFSDCWKWWYSSNYIMDGSPCAFTVHRADWCSGNFLHFYCGDTRFDSHPSYLLPGSGVFRCLSQSLQTNAGISYDRLSPNPCLLTVHLPTSFDAM